MKATEEADEAVRDAGQVQRGAIGTCPLSLRSLLIIVLTTSPSLLSDGLLRPCTRRGRLFMPVVVPKLKVLNGLDIQGLF